MPDPNAVRTAISRLPQGKPIVAVLPGGTTGIGSYIADALAETFSTEGTKLRVYIVGRNADRAHDVMARARTTSPGSDWRFVQATNLAYISQVDQACAEIVRQERLSPLHGEPSIDLMYLTYCWPILKKAEETTEGLDSFLSTTYYSRIRFIMNLMPLLTAKPRPGHVISVYAGGMEDGTKAGESPIGLPPPEVYGVSGVRRYTCFMKNFLFEELANQHSGKLSLIHIFPGLVNGPGFQHPDMPTWFRYLWQIMKPLASLMMTKTTDCGETMVYLATEHFAPKGVQQDSEGRLSAKSTDGEVGGGSYAVGPKGDVAHQTIMYEKVRTPETAKQVWDHTMNTLAHIEAQNSANSSEIAHV